MSDDSEMKMGEWFDTVADAFHLPRPPRVGWDDGRAADRADAAVVHERIAAPRRTRGMKRELRVRLAHPTPHAMLAQIAPRELRRQLALPIG